MYKNGGILIKKQIIKLNKKRHFLEFFDGLSQERLDLIWQIRKFKPNSIYELASKVNKSQPYIQKELTFLHKKGLISLKKHKESGRIKMRPEVEYQILSFEMDFLTE